MKSFLLKRILSLFAVLLFLFIPVLSNSQQITIESNAVIDDGFEDRDGVIGDLVRLVRSNGWRCDSVSAAMRELPLFDPSKFGFRLSCNQFRYKYQFRSRGGIWTACIDKCDF